MVEISDVTKLVKIPIRRMQILTFKIQQMRMRIVAFILSVGTYCIASGQLNDCYNLLFPEDNKTFILVQCNTSLSKNYVALSYVTVVCLIG